LKLQKAAIGRFSFFGFREFFPGSAHSSEILIGLPAAIGLPRQVPRESAPAPRARGKGASRYRSARQILPHARRCAQQGHLARIFLGKSAKQGLGP
jgi:hypothetical protein